MQRENVEIIDDGSIIPLTDENGESVEFYEIACVELKGKYYEILLPVEPLEGLEEDEVVIFELIRSEKEDEDDSYVIVADEEILNEVFTEYQRAIADLDDGCGCDCEDCHHHHDDCDHDHDEE